jgi:predicted transcriptional regulator
MVRNRRVKLAEGEEILPLMKALASDTRLSMLGILTHADLNLSDLATQMNLPHSTASFNLNQLQRTGLVQVISASGARGTQKLCSKSVDEIVIRLPGPGIEKFDNVVVVSMPIGSYRSLEASPPCGMIGHKKIIGMLDDPRAFYEPEHIHAQALWLSRGIIEYAFPNNAPYGSIVTSLALSVELSPSSSGSRGAGMSQVTLWINEREVGTSEIACDIKRDSVPAAFGDALRADAMGKGFLQNWSVSRTAAFIDGRPLSSVNISELAIERSNHVKIRLEVKTDSANGCGVRLVGRKLGRYSQDMIMKITYSDR